ncbi:MAG: hypothetical protein H0U21_17825 [Acidimicrobiia bacterium]|nr:hypothetical protein [Acidimicrobiia bacterium]
MTLGSGWPHCPDRRHGPRTKIAAARAAVDAAGMRLVITFDRVNVMRAVATVRS